MTGTSPLDDIVEFTLIHPSATPLYYFPCTTARGFTPSLQIGGSSSGCLAHTSSRWSALDTSSFRPTKRLTAPVSRSHIHPPSKPTPMPLLNQGPVAPVYLESRKCVEVSVGANHGTNVYNVINGDVNFNICGVDRCNQLMKEK